VDGRTISERVRSLQQEVARIREENQRYLLKHRHTWQEQQLHGDREQRLRQILSELAQLAKDKSPDR
jgi:hypothetical protein